QDGERCRDTEVVGRVHRVEAGVLRGAAPASEPVGGPDLEDVDGEAELGHGSQGGGFGPPAPESFPPHTMTGVVIVVDGSWSWVRCGTDSPIWARANGTAHSSCRAGKAPTSGTTPATVISMPPPDCGSPMSVTAVPRSARRSQRRSR